MKMKWWKRLLTFGMNNEDIELANDLKRNGIYSARVVGRGTLVCDPDEVVQSENFKRLAEEARIIVRGK